MRDNGQETIKEFLNYIQAERGYSSHTVSAYRHDLNTLMDFLEHYDPQIIADLSLIDRQTIRHYLGREFEKGNSSKTVSRRLATIKSLFRYLVEAEVVTDNPAIHVKTPKVEKSLPTFVQSNKIDDLMNMPDAITKI